MRNSSSLCTLALLALTAHTGVESFVLMPSTSSVPFQYNTQLNLIPEQGRQLEAVVKAALAEAEARRELCELEGECGPLATATVVATRPPLSRAARAFVSRVFSLPAALCRRRPSKSEEASAIGEDDVVGGAPEEES